MTPKRLRLFIAACLGAALVAACGQGGANKPTPATGSQVLRVAAGSLPSSLGNPFRGNSRPGSLLWILWERRARRHVERASRTSTAEGASLTGTPSRAASCARVSSLRR